MSDIAERVKKIVVEHLGVEESKVVDDASFIDDLGADSLDTVELDGIVGCRWTTKSGATCALIVVNYIGQPIVTAD